MNRFRKLGFMDDPGCDESQVHSSLLDIVLHDQLLPRNPNCHTMFPLCDL